MAKKQKKNKAEIIVIIDESGSMSATRNDVIGGFNTFIEEQRKVLGEARLTLVTFNNTYHTVIENQKLEDVPLLSEKTYIPGGLTALLDAMGSSIKTTTQRIENLIKKERPDKVIFVVMTDGFENASREFTRDEVFKMISDHPDWDFTYIGANQDAIQVGTSLGFSVSGSINYAQSADGYAEMFKNLNRSVTISRL